MMKTLNSFKWTGKPLILAIALFDTWMEGTITRVNEIFEFKNLLSAAAKSLESCPMCDPVDCSPPGSSVPGILQARTLEWVAISFSNA